MDRARDPVILRHRRRRRVAYAVATLLIVAAVSATLATMEPAEPVVDRATLVLDTVRRGPFVRDVHGLGTLVPEDTRWLPATTEGRVERILLHPGAVVRPDSILVELSNQQVEQEALNARLAFQSAGAVLENLRVQLRNDLLTQQSQVTAIEADYKQAQMEAETNDALAKQGLISSLLQKQSALRAETLGARHEIERQRLQMAIDSIESRIRVQQAAIDQARLISELDDSRLAALRVSAGFAGVLQQVPVEVGQRVSQGQNLARVANPKRLKAELRIPETQARDIEIGQLAYVDTHNGTVSGHVSRKDPAATNGTVTVDVALPADLPRGAVPDLSVDGTIELEHVPDALQVGRPALGSEQTTISLFKVLDISGQAVRVPVRIGRTSANAIEIVSGLRERDQVVLSDMSAWDSVARLRLR